MTSNNKEETFKDKFIEELYKYYITWFNSKTEFITRISLEIICVGKKQSALSELNLNQYLESNANLCPLIKTYSKDRESNTVFSVYRSKYPEDIVKLLFSYV